MALRLRLQVIISAAFFLCEERRRDFNDLLTANLQNPVGVKIGVNSSAEGEHESKPDDLSKESGAGARA